MFFFFVFNFLAMTIHIINIKCVPRNSSTGLKLLLLLLLWSSLVPKLCMYLRISPDLLIFFFFFSCLFFCSVFLSLQTFRLWGEFMFVSKISTVFSSFRSINLFFLAEPDRRCSPNGWRERLRLRTKLFMFAFHFDRLCFKFLLAFIRLLV